MGGNNEQSLNPGTLQSECQGADCQPHCKLADLSSVSWWIHLAKRNGSNENMSQTQCEMIYVNSYNSPHTLNSPLESQLQIISTDTSQILAQASFPERRTVSRTCALESVCQVPRCVTPWGNTNRFRVAGNRITLTGLSGLTSGGLTPGSYPKAPVSVMGS